MLVFVRGYNQDYDESVVQSDHTESNDFRKYKIAKLLLQRGASLSKYLKDNINNPLHWACYFGDLKLTKLLLYYNPHLSKINKYIK